MKKKTLRLMSILCVAALSMSLFVGCGSSNKKEQKAEEPKQEETSNEEELAEGQISADEAVVSDTADGLLESVADEDAYMFLSGVGDGWAPVVMVLLNDNTFYCLVDYAGQATVNFVTGEWVENADGTITATGELYTDQSELVYEIAKDGDTYSVDINIPDTEVVASCTGQLN